MHERFARSVPMASQARPRLVRRQPTQASESASRFGSERSGRDAIDRTHR